MLIQIRLKPGSAVITVARPTFRQPLIHTGRMRKNLDLEVTRQLIKNSKQYKIVRINE
jgi:hypothetical protein